jgi:O-antigen/teichoic acid export membrane protein
LSKNKLIAKNSIILNFRLFITSLSGLLLTRILLTSLGVSDFGIYTVVSSLIILINFLTTTMVSTTYRYISVENSNNDPVKINKVFNISLIIHLSIAFLGIVLSETLGVWYISKKLNIDTLKISDALFIFRFSILTSIIGVFSIPYQGLIYAKEKFSISASIDVIKSILILFLIYVISNFSFIEKKILVYSVVISLITLLSSTVYIFYCRKNYKQLVLWNFQSEFSKYKEMASFSGWILFGATAQVGKDTGSQLVLNKFFGSIVNTSFGIASNINVFVKIFANNLVQSAVPQIVNSIAIGDSIRNKQLVTYLSKYSFFLMYVLALPILLECNFLIKLWLGSVPDYTILFCRLMLVNGLIDSLLSSTPAAIHASGKIKLFQILMSTITIISLPIVYFLFKLGYPPYILLAGYLSSSVLNLFVGLFLLQKILYFDIYYLLKHSYLRVMYVVFLTLPLFFLINIFESSIIRFVGLTFGTFVYVIFVIILVGLTKNEKNYLFDFIYRFKNKIHL